MDILIESIFELIFTVLLEASTDRKISKWIRYPIVFILIIFTICVLGIVGVTSVALLIDDNIGIKLAGIVLAIFDIILIISAIRKIKEEWKKIKLEK